MKKVTLFFLTFLLSNFIIIGQDLQSENFDALTDGNLGTDISGSISGQNGWFTLATGAGQNSDFQIVNEGGSQGKVLQITGAPNDTDAHFVWQNGLDSAWTSRDLGNDVIEVEYDFFTGAATTSKGTTGIQLYNSGYSIPIAGFRFVPETKVITALAWYDPGPGPNPVGNYYFDLGSGGSEIILSPNTWYRIGFAFNKTNGEVIWKGPV
jgi:hypothetical protein